MDPKDKRRLPERDHTIQITKTSPNLLVGAAQPKGQFHCLVTMAGLDVGAVFRLERPHVVVGRDPDCDYVLGDDGISRRHAAFRQSGKDYLVEDLQSTNGVFLNGTRIEESPLAEGDKILLGRSTILKYTRQDDIELSYMRRMHESLSRDGLTGALNRRALEERLGAECSFAMRHGAEISVLMLDVDFFKRINDTFGHPAGDKVLRELSAAVQRTIRKEDIFGRYGGEEFVLVARGIGHDGAIGLARRVRTTIAALRLECDGQPVPVTVSIGAATSSGSGKTSPEELLRIADERLYRAKAGGRNREVGD